MTTSFEPSTANTEFGCAQKLTCWCEDTVIVYDICKEMKDPYSIVITSETLTGSYTNLLTFTESGSWYSVSRAGGITSPVICKLVSLNPMGLGDI